MASHVPGVSFRRVAFRLAKGPSSSFARALCDDGERVRDKIAASKRGSAGPCRSAIGPKRGVVELDLSLIRIKDSSLFGRWWSSAFRLTTPIFVARGPALLFGISRWLSQHGISRKRRNNLTRVLIAVERSTQEPKANSSHPSSREGHRCAGLWFCRSDS